VRDFPRTILTNNEWNRYLISEVTLVIKECLALKDDAHALKKYMHDRQIMSDALIQVRRKLGVEYVHTNFFFSIQHGLAVARWCTARQTEVARTKDDVVMQRRGACVLLTY
jgi:hypothetical protein